MNSLSQSVEPEIVAAAAPATKELPEESVQCCIFLEKRPLVDCIGCNNGHWVCKEALGSYLDVELEKPIEYHQALKGLKCPACTETFAGERLNELLSPKMRDAYSNLRSKCAEKEKHEEEVAAKKPDDLNVLHESIRMQFIDGKGQYKGQMCPTCGFGPIEHFACADLKNHHRQKIAEGVYVNNSCPLCHYFHSNISRWKKWDGTFLSQKRVDRVTEVKAEHELKFENFKKKQENLYKKYEEDSKLVEAKYQEEVAKYKVAHDNWKNYYPNHGVREPHLVRREMSAAKGEKKLELAREYRKAFRLWNREPKEPEHPTGSAKDWLRAKKRKQKELITEKEKEMYKSIEAGIKKLNAEVEIEELQMEQQTSI